MCLHVDACSPSPGGCLGSLLLTSSSENKRATWIQSRVCLSPSSESHADGEFQSSRLVRRWFGRPPSGWLICLPSCSRTAEGADVVLNIHVFIPAADVFLTLSHLPPRTSSYVLSFSSFHLSFLLPSFSSVLSFLALLFSSFFLSSFCLFDLCFLLTSLIYLSSFLSYFLSSLSFPFFCFDMFSSFLSVSFLFLFLFLSSCFPLFITLLPLCFFHSFALIFSFPSYCPSFCAFLVLPFPSFLPLSLFLYF